MTDDVARLEQRVAQLERELADLRAEVERARPGGFRAIRDSRRCPACGGTSFVHIPKLTQASVQVSPLGLVHEWKWSGILAHGELEAFACTACRIVELHVIDLSTVKLDGKTAIAVESEGDPPPAGPYR